MNSWCHTRVGQNGSTGAVWFTAKNRRLKWGFLKTGWFGSRSSKPVVQPVDRVSAESALWVPLLAEKSSWHGLRLPKFGTSFVENPIVYVQSLKVSSLLCSRFKCAMPPRRLFLFSLWRIHSQIHFRTLQLQFLISSINAREKILSTFPSTQLCLNILTALQRS